MSKAAAINVSKRIRQAGLAILCLITAQALLAVASCEPELAPMAARAAH